MVHKPDAFGVFVLLTADARRAVESRANRGLLKVTRHRQALDKNTGRFEEELLPKYVTRLKYNLIFRRSCLAFGSSQ